MFNSFFRIHRHKTNDPNYKAVENISDYCPIELYSTEKNHVEKAITKLIQTPQNNMKGRNFFFVMFFFLFLAIL